ncbi:hypothetical protein [Hydrogenophaga sp.]
MAFKPGTDGEQPQGFEPLTSAHGEGASQHQTVPSVSISAFMAPAFH